MLSISYILSAFELFPIAN